MIYIKDISARKTNTFSTVHDFIPSQIHLESIFKHHIFLLYHDLLDQGYSTLLLETHCPFEISSNLNQTHLNQIIIFSIISALKVGLLEQVWTQRSSWKATALQILAQSLIKLTYLRS